MLSELGWRSLEDRQVDAQLIIFYKIVHGHVAIQLPAYFDKPLKYTHHMHPLAFRQMHTAASYYQYSFYPASVVLSPFCRECGRSLVHKVAATRPLRSFPYIGRFYKIQELK